MSPLTTTYTTGDVICTPYFPHVEDPSEGEARYLICIEDLHDNIIVVPLTKNLNQLDRFPKSFIIRKTSSEGQLMKIPVDSLVVPEKAKMIKKLGMYKHGRCSDDMLEQLCSLCL